MSSYLYHRGTDVYPVSKPLATQVVFGSPSKDCQGSGICKLYTLHAQEGMNSPCAMVAGELLLTEWCMALLVPIRSLPAQHIEGGNFIMEEDFVLPAWLNKQYTTNAPRYIPAGAYPFQCINRNMYIKFALFVCP
jgi:hypothetical protein